MKELCPYCNRNKGILYPIPELPETHKIAERLGGDSITHVCRICWQRIMREHKQDDLLPILWDQTRSAADNFAHNMELQDKLQTVKRGAQTLQEELTLERDHNKSLVSEVDSLKDEIEGLRKQLLEGFPAREPPLDILDDDDETLDDVTKRARKRGEA